MKVSPAFLKNRKQKGFIAVTYAVMITGIVGFCGMAVDAGYMQWNKRRVQIAADAAAMGALRELERSRPNMLTTAGQADASLNGFINGANGTTVEILNPPTSGAYAGDNRAVQAVVRRNFPTMFMRIFGQNSVPIAASAVARTTTTDGTIGACIWALNPTVKSALNLNGTTLDISTNCSIVVESNHPEAFTMGGGPILKLGREARVGVVGGWSLLGQSQILDVSHDPPIDRSPERIVNPGDPFQGLAEPSPFASNTLGYVGPSNLVVRGTSVAYSKNNVPPSNQILPGVYCRGLKIGDTDGQTYTLQAGVYIIYGGGLDVGSSALIVGNGVTIYNTGARAGGPNWGCAGNASQNAYAPVSITGRAGSRLTAPTTAGNFKGMLIWGDRNIADSRLNKLVGGSGSFFDGALYFKRTPMLFAGTSSTNGYLVLVADMISINGTSAMGNNYTGLQEPNPFAPYTTGGGLRE